VRVENVHTFVSIGSSSPRCNISYGTQA